MQPVRDTGQSAGRVSTDCLLIFLSYSHQTEFYSAESLIRIKGYRILDCSSVGWGNKILYLILEFYFAI